jgi:hypothetical protein
LRVRFWLTRYTVQDVVKLVNVAFRGADPETEFCEPSGV